MVSYLHSDLSNTTKLNKNAYFMTYIITQMNEQANECSLYRLDRWDRYVIPFKNLAAKSQLENLPEVLHSIVCCSTASVFGSLWRHTSFSE